MAPPKAKQSQSGQRLKVIIRRLPPDLPPAVFWKTVQPWVPQGAAEGGDQIEDKENNVAWSVFKQGKVRKRYVPLPSPSPNLALTRVFLSHPQWEG